MRTVSYPSASAPTPSDLSADTPLQLLGVKHFSALPSQGHALIRRGISSQILEVAGAYLGLGKAALADFMDLDRSTAARLTQKGQKLPAHAAEALLHLLEIHDLAIDIFATEADASAWLRMPHELLDGERPLDAARTSYGAQMVKNLLLSTRYGGAA